MTRWFRFYDDALNDPKILKLSDNLHRIWVGILCVASKNDGFLPSVEDLALLVRIKPAKMHEAIKSLIKSGLIDDDGVVCKPHNWDGRQYKSDTSNERVKRHRERKCNVTVTPPETEQIQNTETEKKDTREVALSGESSIFDIFWVMWPNKVGKPAAMRAMVAALKRASISAIMQGVDNYIRDKPPDRPWLNPATFLNQNRWEDQPAKVQNGKTSNVIQATDNLVSILDSFGKGAGESNAIRGPEGAANVRLLSQG